MGSSNAAAQSNDLLRKQIAAQNLLRKQKLKSLYGDELVSLKSQGAPTYENPAANPSTPLAPAALPTPSITPQTGT